MYSSHKNVSALLLCLCGLPTTCAWSLLKLYEHMKDLAYVSYNTDSPVEVLKGQLYVQGAVIEGWNKTRASGLCSRRKRIWFIGQQAFVTTETAQTGTSTGCFFTADQWHWDSISSSLRATLFATFISVLTLNWTKVLEQALGIFNIINCLIKTYLTLYRGDFDGLVLWASCSVNEGTVAYIKE